MSSQTSVSTSEIKILCSDGRQLPGTLFLPPEPIAATTIGSGLGIPRRFYAAFAQFLSEHGIAVITFDYRGVSQAEGSDAEDRKVRFEDWGRLDIDAALVWMKGRFPDIPLFHIGHSAGGNLLGLAENSERLDGLILVASNAPHRSHWHGRTRIGLWWLWHVIAPTLAFGRARFPLKKLGLSSVDVPSGVIRQWAAWGRTMRYLFNPAHGMDASRYLRLNLPALVLEFTDDTTFAPPPAVDALLREMPNLQIDRRTFSPADGQVKHIGHLGFFRTELRDTLWIKVSDWIRDIAATTTPEVVQSMAG